ncbi:OsmC family protein [Thiosulfatihalobacter marinus]|jgi:uncharacterized OsmC-like protein|uniref:OsmC family protein n=1 Tax=Thiosulfatihalobacter marinus TaxID=2792481 RepID=UPI0018D86258|nr:OsmC family protein [Thiosulfatihalobacter marinus]
MAIRQKTVISIRMSGHATSHSHCVVSARDLRLTIDEPIERGGTNLGFSPTETAFASLVGCTNTIGHKCAHKLGIDIGNLEFDMEVDFDRRGVLLQEEIEVPFKAIRLVVTASGPAGQSELDQVAAETEKYCAVSKMYKNAGTEVEVSWITK